MNTRTERFVGSSMQADALFMGGHIRSYRRVSGNRRMGTYLVEVPDHGEGGHAKAGNGPAKRFDELRR